MTREEFMDVGMKYIGVVDNLPETVNCGEIVIISGSLETYVYADGWLTLGSYADISTDNNGVIAETNCPNCGAAVDKSLDKCPYCGTPYIRL